MADTLLVDCAQRLLEVAAAALDDPPERAYICVGDSLMTDACPHLSVALAPNGLVQAISSRARGSAQPSSPTTRTATRRALFTVSLLTTECYPTHGEEAEPPDPDDITAAASAVLIDAYDLWTGLRDLASAGTLFQGVLDHGRDGAAVDPATTTFGPQGMTAGVKVVVTADLLVLPSSGS